MLQISIEVFASIRRRVKELFTAFDHINRKRKHNNISVASGKKSCDTELVDNKTVHKYKRRCHRDKPNC